MQRQSLDRAVSSRSFARLACFVLILLGTAELLRAADLIASDGESDDGLGEAVSVSGDFALVSASNDFNDTTFQGGSAYIFKNVSGATGTVTDSIKFAVLDNPSQVSPFGERLVSISGSRALVGARGYGNRSGRAYIYNDLASRSGTIYETITLRPQQQFFGDFEFGAGVCLSGTTAIVGAPGDGASNNRSGEVYVFHSIHTAAGTKTENGILRRSDGFPRDTFGGFLSLSGGIALVGDPFSDDLMNWNPGNAYLYRNVDTTGGTRAEDAQLFASDGTARDYFGAAVSVSGTMAVVGAPLAQNERGFAYVFRDLDNRFIQTYHESAKLIASDAVADGDSFGNSVALSGDNAIIGAPRDESERGSVYLYRNLSNATGTLVEHANVLATEGAPGDSFGGSVAIDGDLFVVGAEFRQGVNDSDGDGTVDRSVGKAYSGSFSSMTVLDAGNTSKNISGLSFIAQQDWIIGQTTDANQVTLFAGDTAEVLAEGKGVYIGQTTGSDSNTLVIEGHLSAHVVQIGSTGGSRLNALQFENTATFDIAVIRIAPGNKLVIEGISTAPFALFNYLGSTQLQVWVNGVWVTVTPENHEPLINRVSAGGRTVIGADIYALNAVSRKTHGASGVWDVSLPISGVPLGIEPRRGSGTNQDTHQLLVTFSQPVTLQAGPNVTSGSGNVGPHVVDGNQVLIDLVNVANAQRLELTFVNVTDGVTSNHVPIPFGVLLGDASGDGTVNAGDALQTRSRAGQDISQITFRSDVTVDGTINSGDATVVKARSGTSVP